MYAVIKTGGKQYRVAAGDKIKVESLAGDVGSQVKLSDVLAVITPGAEGQPPATRFGTPLIAGAAVVATVLSHGRHDKVRIFKMRRRKHFMKHGGHRQNYTELRIDQIG